jgi:hypothetical protein
VYRVKVIDIREPKDIFILLIAKVKLFIVPKYRLSTFNNFLGISEEV